MSLVEQQIFRAIEMTDATGFEWCITLKSKKTSENWMQFSAACIQLYYPFSDPPELHFGELNCPVKHLVLENWEAQSFVVFCHGEYKSTIPGIGTFVENYVRCILKESTSPDAWNVSEIEIRE